MEDIQMDYSKTIVELNDRVAALIKGKSILVLLSNALLERDAIIKERDEQAALIAKQAEEIQDLNGKLKVQQEELDRVATSKWKNFCHDQVFAPADKIRIPSWD
jgi:hypothetical protein